MKKIVIAGRNDGGKSTLVGELYKGLKLREYLPMVVGSGMQDEKPYLQKGIEVTYLTVACPESGLDLVPDLDRVISSHINQLKEKNRLVQHARKVMDELNKVRSVLDLGNLQQRDLPLIAGLPNVALIEAVGINDGYKASECKKNADILVTVIPAGIKGEILMEQGSILLDEADILVITKVDETPRDIAGTNIKMLQRIYPKKPIIPVVATKGIRIELVVEELVKQLGKLGISKKPEV